MDILFSIVISLGAVIGILGMLLLVVGAVAAASADNDRSGATS